MCFSFSYISQILWRFFLFSENFLLFIWQGDSSWVKDDWGTNVTSEEIFHWEADSPSLHVLHLESAGLFCTLHIRLALLETGRWKSQKERLNQVSHSYQKEFCSCPASQGKVSFPARKQEKYSSKTPHNRHFSTDTLLSAAWRWFLQFKNLCENLDIKNERCRRHFIQQMTSHSSHAILFPSFCLFRLQIDFMHRGDMRVLSTLGTNFMSKPWRCFCWHFSFHSKLRDKSRRQVNQVDVENSFAWQGDLIQSQMTRTWGWWNPDRISTKHLVRDITGLIPGIDHTNVIHPSRDTRPHASDNRHIIHAFWEVHANEKETVMPNVTGIKKKVLMNTLSLITSQIVCDLCEDSPCKMSNNHAIYIVWTDLTECMSMQTESKLIRSVCLNWTGDFFWITVCRFFVATEMFLFPVFRNDLGNKTKKSCSQLAREIHTLLFTISFRLSCSDIVQKVLILPIIPLFHRT